MSSSHFLNGKKISKTQATLSHLRKQAKRRNKKRANDPTAAFDYQNLEPRQLLAADLSGLTLVSDLVNDTGISQSDKVTMNDTPDFNVTFANSTGNDFVQLRLGGPGGTLLGTSGLLPVGGGTISVSATVAIPEGPQTIVAVPTTGVGTTDSDSVTIDTMAPMVTITSDKGTGGDTINASETANLTFTFGEDVFGFVDSDLSATTGTAGSVAGSGMNWTGEYTPPASSFDGIATVGIPTGSTPTDRAGNTVAANSIALDVDEIAPTVTITSSDGTGGMVINGTETATITFTLSEPSSTFGTGDATLMPGTGTLGAISPVGALPATVYTATYTPPAGYDSDVSGLVEIKVAAGAFSDVAGNPNAADSTVDLDVDTIAPTIDSLTMSDTMITTSDDGLTVTLSITFDEDMDMTVDPTVSPVGADSQNTLTSAVGSWLNSTTFEVDYVVDASAMVEVADVMFDISLAEDEAGNVMAPVTGESTDPITSIDTFDETLTFTINDSMPQEDVLPNPTLINAEVTFTLDNAADGDTVFTVMVGDTGESATAGADYQVDQTLPGPPAPVGGSYMVDLTIPEGETTVKLDIDMIPDLIWEGDEMFSVKIAGFVSNPGSVVNGGATKQFITIKDNETGADLTIMATDDKATEAFQFEAVDLTGASLFDSDIIVNAGDLVQDSFDSSLTQDDYVTTGGLVTTGGPGNNGLANDGFYGEVLGVHPNVQLSYSDADDGDNARITPQGVPNDVYNLDVPNGQYSEVHLFGAAADGNASVSVRFFYSDGTFATPSQTFADWTGPASSDTYVLTGSNDRAANLATSSVDSNDASIFGAVFAADPTRTLEYIEVSVNTADDAENLGDGGAFAFFGATGVAAEGTMAQYTLKLDFALDHDLTVELTASGVAGLSEIGDPANGLNDYYLSVESTPGSGIFDTPLSVSADQVNVVVPAGLTELAIKLTAKDDMVIEGGVVESFGSEDATLTITNVAPDFGPTPDIGDPDSATAHICDDDQGQVDIEYIAPDSEMVQEGGDSGKIKVNLTKKNTTVEGPTTSSSDTLITVDVTGDADPGDDYRTTITSTEGSFSSPQRVDGFWSKQNDPFIGQPNWAHNSIKAEATGGSKHYYEIVLYQPGQILVDVDAADFNSHIRIFDGSQGSAAANAARGGNNNNGNDPGSTGLSTVPGNDARRQTGTLPAGRYIIEVSRHSGPNNNSNAQTVGATANLVSGDEYLLHISIENFDEGILIPAGQTMTMFNVDPIDDMIVEGGYVSTPPGSFGSENVKFTMTGFARTDPDIMLGDDTMADLDIKDNDEATFRVESTMNGHEDPLTTPPGVPEDGKFSIELTKESSTDTKVKFTILGYNDAADYPGMGVEQLLNDATYGVDYTLSTSGDPGDFQFFTSGSMEGMGFITIPAGETSVDIIVDVINEDFIEDDEFVRLQFTTTSPPNMNDPEITVDGTEASVTIFDEDLSEVAINGTQFAAEGGQNGIFTVSLDDPKLSDTHTEVEFMVVPASSNPADLPPIDYKVLVDATGVNYDVLSFDEGTGKGVVRIPAHKPFGEIEVMAVDDMDIELTEYIKITLVDEFGDPIGPIVGDSNITDIKPGFEMDEIELFDNDEAFVKVAPGQDGKEPGGDQTPGGDPGDVDGDDGWFTVSLVKADGTTPIIASTDTKVFYTVGGTAQPGPPSPGPGDNFNHDYGQLSGMVTIPAGSSSATIWVDVYDDIVNESDQTVEVTLFDTDNDQIDVHSMDEASILILDDDDIVVSITADDAMAREAMDDGRFKISLSGPSDTPVVVEIDVVGGDAIEGSDFVLSTKTVTFAPFQVMAFVDLDVINDAVVEWGSEFVEVAITSLVSSSESDCSDVIVDSQSATIEIKPDPTVTVTALEMMSTEGSSTNPSFIVELPTILGGPQNGEYNLADGDLTVEYTVFVGDPVLYGTPDADYVALSGSVVIPQADGFAVIEVEMLDDMIIEGDEYVSIMLKEVIADPVDGVDSDVSVARDLYSIDAFNPELNVIDSSTGATVKSVDITLADGRDVDGGNGIAVDPVTWEVFAVIRVGSGSNSGLPRELVTIDPATGIATSIGVLSERISDIAFDDVTGTLYGISGDSGGTSNTLFEIDKTDASLTTVVGVSAAQPQSIDYNPLDSELHHGFGNSWESLGLPGGAPVTPYTVVNIGGFAGNNGFEHAFRGNMPGNVFFMGDRFGSPDFYTVEIENTMSGDFATVEFVGSMDHYTSGLAFIKSTDAVKIKDNDSGFIEVKAKEKGEDNPDGTVDTGFNITIRKPDGTTATTSSTDTEVKFMIMDTATPFLGDQFEDESDTDSGNGQNIDTFNFSTGGANNWSLNGSDVPHTIVNGVGDSDPDMYTFTVLNDGDAIDISSMGPVSSMMLERIGGGFSDIGGSSISVPGGVPAGTYKLTVAAADGEDYKLDVAVENHLIADYVLTSPGNDLTFMPGSEPMWFVTIPAGEESIMVNVEVFNDNQIEGDEEVSLWLKTVSDGDPQISTGYVYFADNTDGGNGGNDGIGRVDVGGAGLVKLINTDGAVPGDSDPFGVSIDEAEGKIYWTDADPNVEGIYRANLDGTDVERVIDTGFSPRGLEVVGDYVYWVDEETSEMHRALKDGSGTVEDILDLPSTISDLDDVAVDTVNSKVYWVDDGLNRVARANLDGTMIETLIQFTPSPSTALVPQSIALDVANGKMYWTNAFDNIIQRANLDGSDIETVASANSDFPNGIALDLMNQYVYWADNSGVNSIRRAFYGGALGLGNPVEEISVVALPGTQNLQHLDVLVPTMIHATAVICDNDVAEVYVSSDNKLDEALVDPAAEPDIHKNITVALRDPVSGVPMTSQTSTVVNYDYLPESTASNGLDHAFLDGNVFIPAGQTSANLDGFGVFSVFVQDDALLEGTETVVVGLDAVASGDSDIAIVAPNADMEDMGTVAILDNESTNVFFGDMEDGKEVDPTTEQDPEPGLFEIRLGIPSATDTTVTFMLDAASSASLNDFNLSTLNAANMLQDLGGGMWSVKILASQTSVFIDLNVDDDLQVEIDEIAKFKIVSVVSASGANITFDPAERKDVTIFDNDVAKVIIEGVKDAVESTQTPNQGGESGQFKVSLVDLDGNMATSSTTTRVRVLVDPLSTADFDDPPTYGDYTIPGFTFSNSLGTWFKIVEFAPGENMETLDVNLVYETPDGPRYIDLGDETVKLTLDPTYGIPNDGRTDDGVVGDNQIELDVMDGQMINFVWDPGSPCDDFSVNGMGMNMAEITIVDEIFKINIEATDQNASEPGTLPLSPGDNGQFTISITNPWQFGDTIVNYKIVDTSTATVASEATGGTDPADYQDPTGYDPGNLPGVIEGQIVIPAGASSVVLDILVLDDEVIEMSPETVTVMLTGLDNENTGAIENDPMIGDAPNDQVRMLGTDLMDTVNIFDDDGAIADPSASDSMANEPNSPGDNGQFKITLLEGSDPIISDEPTTVTFEISGDAILGGAGAADFTSGADYKLVLNSSTDGNEGFTLVYNPVTKTGTVVIPAGFSMALIDVVTLDDYILEDDETAELTVTGVSNPNGGISAGTSTAVVTIEDTDEGVLKLVTQDGSGSEPGGLVPQDASYQVFLVDADDNSQRLVSDTDTDVTFETKGSSTATPDVDYSALGTMVTIPAFTGGLGDLPDLSTNGDGQALIPVFVLDDDEVEPTETVDVGATDVMGDMDIDLHPMASMLMGSVDILDDDTGLVSIKSDSAGADDDVREGNPGPANNGKFEVILDAVSATDTVVTFMVDDTAVTANPNATYGSGTGGDYTLSGVNSLFPVMGTVTIPAGQLTATIDLTTTNDLTQEGLEDVTVKLVSASSSGGGSVGIDGTMDDATITIEDDDFPTFIVNNTMADEGDGKVTFTIDLTAPIDVDVSVFLTLSDGTAEGISGSSFDPTAGDEDYNNDNTVLVTFPANGGVSGTDLSRTIMIDVNDDIWVEKDENFFAELVIQGASLPNTLPDGREVNILDANDVGYGEAIIKNNDTATFTIFEKDDPSSDPTVVEGNDPPNPYNNGSPTTPVEFEVELSNPISADVDVVVSFGGGTATGGAFNVTGSGNITGGAASFGTDYRDTNVTVTFDEGEYGSGDRKMVTVPVIRDLIVEGGPVDSPGVETFVASLTPDAGDLMGRPSVATDTSTATIIDDDSAKVSVMTGDPLTDPYEASEDGHTPDFGDGKYTIALSKPTDTDVIVKFQMSGDADLGDDYNLTAPAANMLTDLGGGMFTVKILEGDTSVMVTLEAVSEPALIEDDEFAIMTLVELQGDVDADIMIGEDMDEATVRINDGDPGTVKITADPNMAIEGGTDGKFIFNLIDEDGDAVSDADTVVKFTIATGPGNATPGVDYVLTGDDIVSLDYSMGMGEVLIPAGQSMAMMTVEAINDVITEGDEAVTVTVSEITDGNADIQPDPDMPTDTVTVKDDGDGLFVKVEKAVDGDGAETNTSDDDNGLFRVFLVDANGDDANLPAVDGGKIRVQFSVGVDDDPSTPDAIESEDYQVTDFEVEIQTGSNQNFVEIFVLDDLIAEFTETLKLTIVDIQDANAVSITELSTGEDITIDPDCMMDTMVILDDDDDPTTSGVYANSEDWSSNFRDNVSGAAGLGYEIVSGTGDTLPWTNVGQFIIAMNQPVDYSTVDLGDFALSGSPGSVPASIGPAIIPTIDSWAPGASANEIVLTLSDDLMAAELELDILGSGILNTGGVSFSDHTIEFLALPGDASNDSLFVLPNDVSNVGGRVISGVNPDGSFINNYDYRSDLDGNAFILPNDYSMAASLLFSNLVVPPPFANGNGGNGGGDAGSTPDVGGMSLMLAPFSGDTTVSVEPEADVDPRKSISVSSPSLTARSSIKAAVDTAADGKVRDAAFEDLFSDNSKKSAEVADGDLKIDLALF